jgi:nodulation protein E
VTDRRVVVTGLGVVSALGMKSDEFWRRLQAGQCGIRPLVGLDNGLRFNCGAQVIGYDEEQWFDRRACDLLDRFAQFLLLATREAVAGSGLVWDDALKARTAVVTGSCLGGQTTQDQGYVNMYGEKRGRMRPLTIPRVMANAGASHVSMEFGITGPAFTLSTACASSNHAIGLAYWMVRQGMAAMAIAGGSETPFTWPNLKAWEALRVMAPDTCRPFSKDRRGLVLGEGGAAVILEPLDRALARGAPIHAEIVGFGMSSDAQHVTMPSADGAAEAIRAALADAGMEPEAVGYINAHGTGTLANDAMEAQAIRKVFGAHADRLAVSSTKSLHGHTLGAAGAVECIATVLALRDGVLPPTVGFTERDPECDLDVVPNQARQAQVENALSNSFAFGGMNAVLALRRWND